MISCTQFPESNPLQERMVRHTMDDILMSRLMLTRNPAMILLNAARHVRFEGLDDQIMPDVEFDSFWLLYDLALTFRKGCAL